MDGWVVETLKANGLAGVCIFLLVGAVIALWQMNKAKDRQISKLHAERAVERETLVTLMERSTAAGATTAAVTKERNEVIDRLSTAIMAQTNSSDRLADRVANHAETTKDKLSDVRHVIDATGESYRVLNGLVAEIRNLMVSVCGKVDAVAVDVKAGNRA